jgi:hypothetical protein
MDACQNRLCLLLGAETRKVPLLIVATTSTPDTISQIRCLLVLATQRPVVQCTLHRALTTGNGLSSCLRFLNKNSARYGQTVDEAS